MTNKLKKTFIKSIVILAIIHLIYFIYGYFQFVGIQKIDVYTEFYRFEFSDEVSISHFFISSLFLILFLFFSKYGTKEKFSALNIFKISCVLLLISFLCFSFFISYSLGLNAKLKTELTEKDFNKDKSLLNVLNPFLYKYTSYCSEKLFNFENIVYPEPYPIILDIDTTFYDTGYEKLITEEYNYYSIDTLEIHKSDYNKIESLSDTIYSKLGFNEVDLSKRIISKKIYGDSVKIVYKGENVYPKYDDNTCIFMQNKVLFSPINNYSIYKQQYISAKERYCLLYKFNQDSLKGKLERLNILLKKYNIESEIKPNDLTIDIFHYRDKKEEPLNEIRNIFNRNALIERFAIINKLFYKPNYLHPLIQKSFFNVVFVTWSILLLFFILVNFRKSNKK
jgi:hypothetical protein